MLPKRLDSVVSRGSWRPWKSLYLLDAAKKLMQIKDFPALEK